MKRTMVAGVFLAIGLGAGCSRTGAPERPATEPVVFLVRHAEKAAHPVDDPSLTPAGAERAQALAAALRDAGITAVITTQLRRSIETAEPLAAARGLTPEVVPVERGKTDAHIGAVAAAVRRHAGGVVLVVGHSNTVTPILGALGGPALPELPDSAYGNLYLLVPGDDAPRLVHLHYGAPDPLPGEAD
jgi:broad specificity phosphatase PhoE